MPTKQQSIQYPHCDSRVLHAPGECEFCDLHPLWQQMREDQKINFTGHYEGGKMKCPAEQVRTLEMIYAFTPNRRKPNVPEAIKAVLRRHGSIYVDDIAKALLEKFEVFPKEGFIA